MTFHISVPPSFREIRLNKGAVAIVDAEDFDRLNAVRWSVVSTANLKYANRKIRKAGDPLGHAYMHRAILMAPVGVPVDHIDSDGLNNRRSNLRLASYSQNAAHRRRAINNTSGYRGVTRQWNRWVATLCVNGKQAVIGRFDDPIEAAMAYDRAALAAFGEFASLNFPEDV